LHNPLALEGNMGNDNISKEIEKIITKKIRKVKNVNTTTTLSVISEQENL